LDAKKCECGCGLPVSIAPCNNKKWGWVKGQPIRFIHNHHHRGHRNVNFNMGLCFFQGRWFIHCRDNSYIAYARAVLEGHLKRELIKNEVVHHKNKIKTDDRYENLQLMPNQKTHMMNHIKYSDDDLLQKLRDLADKLGRLPLSSDIDNNPDMPTRETYRIRLGGLMKARVLAGLVNSSGVTTV